MTTNSIKEDIPRGHRDPIDIDPRLVSVKQCVRGPCTADASSSRRPLDSTRLDDGDGGRRPQDSRSRVIGIQAIRPTALAGWRRGGSCGTRQGGRGLSRQPDAFRRKYGDTMPGTTTRLGIKSFDNDHPDGIPAEMRGGNTSSRDA